MSAPRHADRGQATVELALGALVLVTVILFGIHFAEVGFLRLKLEEAVNFALWDASGHRLHRFDPTSGKPDWSLVEGAIRAAGANGSARYLDLDGRASRRDRPGVVHALTRASPIRVDCRPDRSVPWVEPSAIARAALPDGRSGMSCRAEAALAGDRIARSFAEVGSFFDAPHRVELGTLRSGQFAVQLDDWGFSGPEERKECSLGRRGCGGRPDNRNPGFYWLVARIAGSSGAGTEASDLARFTVGTSPIDESELFLSFRGSESRYRQASPAAGHGDAEWETSPFLQACKDCSSPYAVSRSDCWLGRPCDPATW